MAPKLPQAPAAAEFSHLGGFHKLPVAGGREGDAKPLSRAGAGGMEGRTRDRAGAETP